MSNPTPPIAGSPRRRLVTAGVITGMFLAALEATVVGTAMPTVIAALGGMAHYGWVFSAYLLASTVTVPVWGRLSDLFGRRILYQLAIGLFLIGSVLSGLAYSMPALIAWRALQGLGAGGLVPLGMTIIGDLYTVRERARMQGLFSGVWGLSSVVGPLVGGFLTDQLSWRWVFFINVPIGIVAAVIMGVALRHEPRPQKAAIDYLGAVTLTVAVTMLMLVFVDGGTLEALASARSLVLLAVTAVLLAWFIAIERRVPEPIVPLSLFSNPVVTVAVLVGFLSGAGMFGAISFVPLFAQGTLGSSATAAGSMLTPLMLAWVTSSVVGGRLLIRVGWRPLVLFGTAVLVVGFGGLTLFSPEWPVAWLIADLALIGCGLGFTMLTLLIAVQQSVPREQLGIATSLNQFFRSIGGAVGVAILGAMMTAGLTAHLFAATEGVRPALTKDQATRLAESPDALVSPEARAGLSGRAVDALQDALALSLRRVFFICAVLAALSFLVSFLLPAGRPREGTHSEDGERMVMSEMTTIDAKNDDVS